MSEAGRPSLRDAERLLQRGETAQAAPAFFESLDASGGHVGVLTRVLRQLEPSARAKLIDDGQRLVRIAENSAPDEFARSVRDEARRLETDRDPLQRMERQRRAIRCNLTPRRPNHDHRPTQPRRRMNRGRLGIACAV